jgi:hypothetical protein
MAIHHQLPIHKTGSELLGLAARVHAQMPRGYKRTVGDKIVAHCSEMLDLMALANASRGEQRQQCIREILRGLAEWTGLEPATPGVTGRWEK